MRGNERLRIIKRTHEGRKIAQAKGVRMGELRRQRQHDFEAGGMTRRGRTCHARRPFRRIRLAR